MKNMTAKQIEKALQKSLSAIKEAAEAGDKKRREPPECLTYMNACVVCHGDIIGAHEAVYSDKIGDQSPPSWRFLGYHCQYCGLMYHHPPFVKDQL